MPLFKDNQREDTLIAYIAGLIDGEGTIRIAKIKTEYGYKYQGQIQMVNTHYDVVKMTSEFLGGTTIHAVNNKQYQGSYQKRKQVYVTKKVGTVEVQNYVEQLMPYLRIKKPQAELVIKLCRDMVTFMPKKGIKRTAKRISLEEAQRREYIYQQYLSLVHPQRLSEQTPKR